MGIVGEPPTPASIVMFSFAVFAIGIVDLLQPETHISFYILGFIGVVSILYYFLTCRDVPQPTLFHVTEVDGSKHDELFENVPTSFGTLLVGIGLSVASFVTYLLPFTRITSLIFIIFGTYALGMNLWVYYEVFLKREEKVNG